MKGLNIFDYIVMIFYFLLMIGIGYYSRKKSKDQEGYFMGSRGFGKILQTFAAFGAGTSADSPIGTVRNIVVGGLSGIWTVLNWLFCTPFYWFMGKWYRRMRIITLGDFYDERFDSRGLAGTYAIFALIFFMGYISIGFSATSKTISAIAPKSETSLNAAERIELAEFRQMKELEEKDYATLTTEEKQTLADLRVKNPRGLFPFINPNYVMLAMGIVTVIYSVLGGITAAYFTDLIQGSMIILLSIILIPFSLLGITQKFGSGGEGLFDGFRIMHDLVPEEFFDIFGGAASDFTWYYLLAIVSMNLIGIIVQPHQLSVGGATAKDELSGRIGIVGGNLLKRFCTLFWALTALFIITLFSKDFADPDLAWGFATRMLLGPLGIGLVGLMLASLFAAVMSSVSAYMVSASALITRNLFKPFYPDKSEKLYVNVGRTAGVVIILGAIYLSIYFQDIFMQFKFIWEIPIIFGASLWVGLLWRRTSATAVWTNVVFSGIFFFILPATISTIIPDLSKNPKFLMMTKPTPIVRVYEAKEFDVIDRDNEINNWLNLTDEQKLIIPKQEKLNIGDKIQKTFKPKSKSIFWTKGIIVHKDGTLEGQGLFNLEMILFQKLGMNLESYPNPVIETLRLPFRIILPILIIIIISLFTAPVIRGKTDRFFVKMFVPIDTDLEKDRINVENARKNPLSLEHRKMFPNSNFELEKLSKEDVIGFILTWFVVIAIIFLAIGMALIGS